MERKVHIYPIEKSIYNHQVVGDNWSTVVSELIRITAHYCDSYLSDVFYDIKQFVESIDEGTEYNKVLVFREDGIGTYRSDIFEEFLKEHETSGARAYFRLEYDPETGFQRLTKLDCCVITCSY